MAENYAYASREPAPWDILSGIRANDQLVILLLGTQGMSCAVNIKLYLQPCHEAQASHNCD